MRNIDTLKERLKAIQDKRAEVLSRYRKQDKAKKLTDAEKIDMLMEYLGIDLSKEE